MTLSPHWCVLRKLESDSTNHLFLHYSLSSAIWYHFFGSLSYHWVMPNDLGDLVNQWSIKGMGTQGSVLWSYLLHGVFWGLRKERN